MTAKVAFLFPGQGSQAVGMGADIFATSPAARRIFETVDEALGVLPQGVSLSTLCFQGPEETLRETINAQPAIVTVSLAILAALQEALSPQIHSAQTPATQTQASSPQLFALISPLTPAFMAGHSVGEYAALIASGALDLTSAIRLVRERGRLMHAEGTVCPGGMAAVLGLDGETLQDVCKEATQQALAELAELAEPPTHPGQGRVTVANYNAPGQVVLSGEQRALAIASELAKARGAKRIIPLAVSGAFHSPVMQPAADALVRAIEAVSIHDSAIPTIGNIYGTPLIGMSSIREELAQQVAAPVQWIRTIEYCVQAGTNIFFEIGPGQALTGMVKRIAKGAKDTTAISVGNAAEVEKAIALVRETALMNFDNRIR